MCSIFKIQIKKLASYFHVVGLNLRPRAEDEIMWPRRGWRGSWWGTRTWSWGRHWPSELMIRSSKVCSQPDVKLLGSCSCSGRPSHASHRAWVSCGGIVQPCWAEAGGATVGCKLCKAEKVPRPVQKKGQSEDKFLHLSFSRQWHSFTNGSLFWRSSWLSSRILLYIEDSWVTFFIFQIVVNHIEK